MTEWFTVSRLSDNQEHTPEGFLLCKNVPIARTGTQLYRDHEIPQLDADDDGWITVARDAAEVFRPESIASFMGKPITDDHPFEAVGPRNWGHLAIGGVHNVRRGTGDQADVLLADLLFTTERGISAVRNGKRAISVGYDAHYERTGRGLGRQKNIVANHVALVDEGRCGQRCQIVDGRRLYNDSAGALEHGELEAVEGRPKDCDDVDYAADDIDYAADADIDYRDAEPWENQPREPSGRPEGGQFASAGGSGGSGSGPASSLLKEPPQVHSKEALRAHGDAITKQLGLDDLVNEARAKQAARGNRQTIDRVEDGGHMQANGKFTRSRAALHRRMIRDLFTKEAIARAQPEPGQKPVVTVLGGRGGSGKSWITGEHGPVDKSKAILVDADHFKQNLPEYEGWNAAELHEESDHLVNLAEKEAIKRGVNVIHDATLKSADNLQRRVAAYKAAGYDVHGHYMHLPREMAAERALDRFGRGQKKNGKGRFVPPEVVLGNTQNEANFDAMIPQFKQWSVFDNRGASPKYVAGSEHYARYAQKAGDRKPAPRPLSRKRLAGLGRQPARQVRRRDPAADGARPTG